MSGSRDPIVEEQLEYYCARAPEYDQWWLREGRYDRGSSLNRSWFSDCSAVEAALEEFRPSGRILELACGTGIWSEKLLPCASGFTLVDGSMEMLGAARERLDSPLPNFVCADLFDWQPDGQFDTIFFSFWLSHVPPERFSRFWQLVAESLAPGGRVFFLDSRYEPTSAAIDHQLPDVSAKKLRRRLNDGREYQIYKIHYDPRELERELSKLGWNISVHTTERYFLYGHGQYRSA